MEENKSISISRLIFKEYIFKIKSMKRIIIPTLIFIFIGAYTEVLLSEIIKDIPDKFHDQDKISKLILHLAIVSIIYSFSSELGGYLVSNPLQKVFSKSMKDCLESYINLEYSTFKKVGVGKILKIMERKSTATGEIICLLFIQIIPIPVSFFFLSISLIRNIHYMVYLIILAHVLLYIYFTFKITDYRTTQRKASNEELNEANNISNEILCNYEGVKSYNKEEYEINRFRRQLGKALGPLINLWQNLYVLDMVQKSVLTFMDIFVCCYFYVNRNNGSITNKETVFQYFLVSNLIRKKFSNLGSIYGNLMIMTTNVKTSIIPEKENMEGEEMEYNNEIQFIDVSIRTNKKEILSKLNLTINKGDKIALIGSNGSGKTTFIRVLLGFYDYRGSIKIDGKELYKISKRHLRNSISFVPQDSCLMNETIKENICYGEKFSEEEIFKVSEKYKVYDSFARLEHGFLTKIGERGKNLSGGEKQKVALIRGAIRNKQIFILDEPTAAIDREAENDIFSSLLSDKDTTVLTIIHNLDLLKNFNKVLHFSNESAILYDSFEEFNSKNVNQIDFYKHFILSSDQLDEDYS